MSSPAALAAVRDVIFYFDPVSPYAWLAAQQTARIEAAGLRIVCRPVLFAGLLNAHGQKGPAEVPAKRLALFRDIMRLAAQAGVPFSGPPAHPFNPLRALRTCIAVDDDNDRLRLAKALMDGAWIHGRDLSQTSVVDAIAGELGLDVDALSDAAVSPQIKAQLAAQTEAAVAAGVFGVPTFALDGELFWGADRIGSLLWRAGGQTIDELQLQGFLARGASSVRKTT